MGLTTALGSFRRTESIPILIEALAEDECRLAAETALRKLGRAAEAALVEAASAGGPPAEHETVSSLRQRRSALSLLTDLKLTPGRWPALRHLLADRDHRIVFLACQLCLEVGSREEQAHAARRLDALLADADWMLAQDVHQCLASHFDTDAGTIAKSQASGTDQDHDARSPRGDRPAHGEGNDLHGPSAGMDKRKADLAAQHKGH